MPPKKSYAQKQKERWDALTSRRRTRSGRERRGGTPPAPESQSQHEVSDSQVHMHEWGREPQAGGGRVGPARPPSPDSDPPPPSPMHDSPPVRRGTGPARAHEIQAILDDSDDEPMSPDLMAGHHVHMVEDSDDEPMSPDLLAGIDASIREKLAAEERADEEMSQTELIDASQTQVFDVDEEEVRIIEEERKLYEMYKQQQLKAAEDRRLDDAGPRHVHPQNEGDPPPVLHRTGGGYGLTHDAGFYSPPPYRPRLDPDLAAKPTPEQIRRQVKRREPEAKRRMPPPPPRFYKKKGFKDYENRPMQQLPDDSPPARGLTDDPQVNPPQIMQRADGTVTAHDDRQKKKLDRKEVRRHYKEKAKARRKGPGGPADQEVAEWLWDGERPDANPKRTDIGAHIGGTGRIHPSHLPREFHEGSIKEHRAQYQAHVGTNADVSGRQIRSTLYVEELEAAKAQAKQSKLNMQTGFAGGGSSSAFERLHDGDTDEEYAAMMRGEDMRERAMVQEGNAREDEYNERRDRAAFAEAEARRKREEERKKKRK